MLLGAIVFLAAGASLAAAFVALSGALKAMVALVSAGAGALVLVWIASYAVAVVIAHPRQVKAALRQRDEARAKLATRLEEVQADYEKRLAKLREAHSEEVAAVRQHRNFLMKRLQALQSEKAAREGNRRALNYLLSQVDGPGLSECDDLLKTLAPDMPPAQLHEHLRRTEDLIRRMQAVVSQSHGADDVQEWLREHLPLPGWDEHTHPLTAETLAAEVKERRELLNQFANALRSRLLT